MNRRGRPEIDIPIYGIFIEDRNILDSWEEKTEKSVNAQGTSGFPQGNNEA